VPDGVIVRSVDVLLSVSCELLNELMKNLRNGWLDFVRQSLTYLLDLLTMQNPDETLHETSR
jgi:hypothetical protein